MANRTFLGALGLNTPLRTNTWPLAAGQVPDAALVATTLSCVDPLED